VIIARGLFRAVENVIRVTFTLFFAGLAIALIIAAANAKPKVPSTAALVLDINGTVVEQESARSPRDVLAGASGSSKKETVLKDLIDALDAGRDDKRIKAALLLLDDMGGAGMTKLQDLGTAIDRFRKSGKKVVAYADSYSQNAYYLASRSDELYMHPQGMVLLEGLASYRWYYKDAIDKIGLEWNVFRVGEYKSAVEPYLRNDMSAEAKQANLDWMGDLWASYVDDVAKARKKKPEEITALIEGLPERLKEAGGDGGRLALKERLVDKLMQRDEVRKRLIELAGEDKKFKSYNRIGFQDYLTSLGGNKKEKGKGDAVAVVVAKGEILDGRQPAGKIGGDSTAALIRKAREDEKVKAIVLRVDSPGGSAFASEVIRRELELARQEKKPVVVSMGSVAASGGYWISTSSDEIWANPNTITGSIGIFGMFPNFGKAMATHLGVHVDGVGTTPMAGALRLDRPLDPRVGEAIQSAIDRGYEEFLERVAAARKMKIEDVDKIARGRVWSGKDALSAGLVDKLGGVEDAIQSAAQKARLAKDFRVVYIEKDLTMKEKLLRSFASRAFSLSTRLGLTEEASQAHPSPLLRLEEKFQEEAARLGIWNDPHGIYAHCLCELP
jgi:protease-4